MLGGATPPAEASSAAVLRVHVALRVCWTARALRHLCVAWQPEQSGTADCASASWRRRTVCTCQGVVWAGREAPPSVLRRWWFEVPPGWAGSVSCRRGCRGEMFIVSFALRRRKRARGRGRRPLCYRSTVGSHRLPARAGPERLVARRCCKGCPGAPVGRPSDEGHLVPASPRAPRAPCGCIVPLPRFLRRSWPLECAAAVAPQARGTCRVMYLRARPRHSAAHPAPARAAFGSCLGPARPGRQRPGPPRRARFLALSAGAPCWPAARAGVTRACGRERERRIATA